MAHSIDTADRIVIKVGSALIVDAKTRTPNQYWLATLAADIAELCAAGKQVVLVSSGAAALGRPFLSDAEKSGRQGQLELKQAAAAIGQPRLMAALQAAFDLQKLPLAQALLTLEDTEIRRRWLNGRATLFTLMDNGVVPVINENDTVATSELRYGDNDRLAARVAQMVGADLLILLSDIDGLYTDDPRKNPNAEFIQKADAITPELRSYAGDANSSAGVGTGGMATKLDAAEIAWSAGCSTVITIGKPEHPLRRLRDGGRATWIVSDLTPQAARMSWLAGHLTPEGAVTIDKGAEQALISGASLLAVGIKSVAGQFPRGAAIAIQNQTGKLIAKGVSAYQAAEIEQIKGLQSAEITARLGYPARSAVIHRDNMILIDGDD